MKHILMPTDFSKNSWNAIQYGLSMFKETECTFHLLTVDIIPTYAGAQTSVRANQEKLRKHILRQSEADLKELLKRIEKLPSNTKHKFITNAVYGSFFETVKMIVEKDKTELIIMGTKGASGLKKMIVGSNTAALISKVDCPLLAVPENAAYHQPREIAFATDFNISYSLTLLDQLKEIVSLNKVPLRILNVLEKDDTLDDQQTANKLYLKNYLKDIEHTFHTLTNNEVESAIQCFVESRDIDMIVMLAKNRVFSQRIWLKPTVKNISYQIEIPFLVLRE